MVVKELGGVAHVASPLQNVVLLAPVPLLRWDTGRFPVTPVVRGKPVALVKVPEEGVPKAPPTGYNVPLVGKVTAVAADKVPAKVNAPENVTLPPMVIVLDPLFTPVPPFAGDAMPEIAGVAHVPSPRQNVVPLAPEPPAKLVTGRFPVTPVVNGKLIQLVKSPLDGSPNASPLVYKVPEVGNVTAVDPVRVPVNGNAPENVTAPPIVRLLLPLFTPVPP